MKEEVNPHLLLIQFKLDQSMRRENLRISGLPESQEENEEVLKKLKKLLHVVLMVHPQRLPRPNQRMDNKISQENQNPADLLSGFCQEGSGTSTLIAGLNTRGKMPTKEASLTMILPPCDTRS